MENASKALIIAGAILLSILIIALGIYVFNMAKGASNTGALDDLEIQQFNEQFTNYEGVIQGSVVKSLLQKAIANAKVYKDAPERIPSVKTVGGSNSQTATGGEGTSENGYVSKTYVDTITTMISGLANKHNYFVSFKYSDETGLINEIIIDYDSKGANALKTKE